MHIPISGYGLITGFGDTQTSLDAVFNGEVNDRPLSLDGIADSARPTGGALTCDHKDALRDLADDGDPALGMIIAAAAAARHLEVAAQLPLDEDLALVLATNFACLETMEWCWQERLDTGELDEDTFKGWAQSVDLAAQKVGAGGKRCQLSLSCASGTGAASLAKDWLMAGIAKRVLVVTYDALTNTCWTGLSNLRTISDDRVRPFDERRRGTVFSEGAAAILLDPQSAGDLYLSGAASNNNAFHMTAPAKRADGSRRVLAAAMQDAEIGPETISFVSAHATGTLANDRTESEAIIDLFGEAPPPVLGLKSSLGHLLGAAGLAELIVAAEAIRRDVLPAVQNSEQPAPECISSVVRTPKNGKYHTALINSAGIGGSNGGSVITNQSANEGALSTPTAITPGVQRIGWVLPNDNTGTADDLTCLADASVADPDDSLSSFSARPFLQSVKGYLDPTGASALSAAALCLRDADGNLPDDVADFALITATTYGPLKSGYTFYEQMQQRGPHLASPMIFPHLYSSTPGNLAAIEFGIAGPHLIFDHVHDLCVPFDAARALLTNGRAKDVLVILFEHAFSPSLPDSLEIGAGAIALHLTAAETDNLPKDTPTPNGTISSILN